MEVSVGGRLEHGEPKKAGKQMDCDVTIQRCGTEYGVLFHGAGTKVDPKTPTSPGRQVTAIPSSGSELPRAR